MSTYYIKQSTDGQYYFVIVAANNKILATSELYKRKVNAIKGIRACFMSQFKIKDTTKKRKSCSTSTKAKSTAKKP